MSKPGYPYDNRCVESFFASIKKESILRKEYDQMSTLSKDLFYENAADGLKNSSKGGMGLKMASYNGFLGFCLKSLLP